MLIKTKSDLNRSISLNLLVNRIIPLFPPIINIGYALLIKQRLPAKFGLAKKPNDGVLIEF